MILVPDFQRGSTLTQADMATLVRAVRELQALAVEHVEYPLEKTFTTLSAPGTVGASAYTFGNAATGWPFTGATADAANYNGVWYPAGYRTNGKRVWKSSRLCDSGMGEYTGTMFWLTDASWVDPWLAGARYASGGAWIALFGDPQTLVGPALGDCIIGPQSGDTPAGVWYYDKPGFTSSRTLAVY